MSFAELDDIREQGIDGIVNLCEEFCDLHELEEQSGFEVFYLPITDERAPQMEEMEKGLEWMDEAIYLGKKILVHCRHGVGRTGTFVTAYLLRRGLGLRKAEKILKKTRANPTNFSQWWLLRKYGKKEGKLKVSEATPENRTSLDLSEFYARYEQLLRRIDTIAKEGSDGQGTPDQMFCTRSFSLAPIEAIYLNEKVNIGLSANQRKNVIESAAIHSSSRKIKSEAFVDDCCPLFIEDACLLTQHRPIQCRIRGIEFSDKQLAEISHELSDLSRGIFKALIDKEYEGTPPSVPRTEAISGKFIQKYFQHLTSWKAENGGK
jgi:protein-tyrosine phosphatase